ncbi:MAG: segregation/condensation protein A [Candidatus Marinimicrobia bacterium CG_4_10_14_0_2_um_filter_48_9]|nr:MAG: segregation/condensation protein A [Candidatus Marinimicrobia bacterium CG_4_10_14_0_2_um_filter_48_9]
MAKSSSMQNYSVDLPIFEGPLDLLLFLIKKDELNIYDIPISKITKDFLAYLEVIKELRLTSAGDFVLMAATLMKIKARMLLPQSPQEGEEIDDPRNELVNMLLEYRRFKEAAEHLGDREHTQNRMYYRIPAGSEGEFEVGAADLLADVKLYDIMLTFQYLLQNYEAPYSHEVVLEEVSTTEQGAYLKMLLGQKEELWFSQIIQELGSRLVVIVTFLSILELIRNREILMEQNELFSDLRIRRGERFGKA